MTKGWGDFTDPLHVRTGSQYGEGNFVTTGMSLTSAVDVVLHLFACLLCLHHHASDPVPYFPLSSFNVLGMEFRGFAGTSVCVCLWQKKNNFNLGQLLLKRRSKE